MRDVIQAVRIVKEFGELKAVNGIDFAVRRGETFGILGENGAGKSTTIRMIACRSPLTSGELFVDGSDVRRDERRIRSILGVVPQENNLDPDLNVRENLLVYARYFRIPADVSADRSDELLDFIGLTHKANDKVDTLSGGMKRRLIIARALLQRPQILLLDEPTTGLDPSVRHEIWRKLEELRRAENITIVLSTHYMDEAEKLCNRLVVLAEGKIIAAGVPREIIHERVKKFALEIRTVDRSPLLETESAVIAIERGNSHVYFAETAEELTPLMEMYRSERLVLRPANLEDVFLQLVEKR